nr:darobactin family peptide antibiotic [Yersinia rochesterensis]
MALKTKLESLEQSFKNNLFSINDHEIENLKRSNADNQITAWNWSKSFTQQ